MKKNKKEIQMTKSMKKCSMSLTMKEIQIKASLRFHLTPVRMAVIQKANNKQMLVRMRGKRGPKHSISGNVS
jgi:hypothetical protein